MAVLVDHDILVALDRVDHDLAQGVLGTMGGEHAAARWVITMAKCALGARADEALSSNDQGLWLSIANWIRNVD